MTLNRFHAIMAMLNTGRVGVHPVDARGHPIPGPVIDAARRDALVAMRHQRARWAARRLVTAAEVARFLTAA
ncbi:hypothetical protein LCGC14_2955030 [marine sediment metagenome]|uniref:TubC N-terminal docking domain-containing protein n=1 Tax=marine sediment metagenome TaxID=412755 RepID=A0A0F8Y173_9ZZZZ